MCRKLQWDDSYRPDRGKVLNAEELEKIEKFSRYLDVDGDGIAARSLPGTHPKGGYFTRGSGHTKHATYTEDSAEYQEVVDRLTRKMATAANAVPAPEFNLDSNRDKPMGIVSIGGCHGAVTEAVARLRARGIAIDYMRIRAFPFPASVREFLVAHPECYVVEQNRDGQLRTLLAIETGLARDSMKSVLDYGGLPLTAEVVINALAPEPLPATSPGPSLRLGTTGVGATL
jgi:2-oxoglutarate ferredoxin oxidoreductase subunit alpha